MSEYTNLISALRKKVGPITLEEILKLQELQTLPAAALAPGTVERSVVEELKDLGEPVTRFGAIAGGSAATNNVAFQAAANEGIPILVPAGEFNLSAEINVTEPGTAFIGKHRRASKIISSYPFIFRLREGANDFAASRLHLESTDDTAIDLFYGLIRVVNESVDGIHISQCYFTAPDANTNAFGLYADKPDGTNLIQNIWFLDNIVENMGNSGMCFQNHILDDPAWRIRNFWIERNLFRNMGQTSSLYGMIGTYTGRMANGWVRNNIGDNLLGIGLEMASGNYNVHFIGNCFRNITRRGYGSTTNPISISSSSVPKVSHYACSVIGNFSEAGHVVTGGLFFGNMEGLVLSNNSFDLEDSVVIRDCNDTTGSHNKFRCRLPAKGLVLEGTSGASCKRNHFLETIVDMTDRASAVAAVVSFEGTSGSCDKNILKGGRLLRPVGGGITATTNDAANSRNVIEEMSNDFEEYADRIKILTLSDADSSVGLYEAQYRHLRLTGTLTATRSVVVPREWRGIIHNNTTGGQSVSVAPAGGTGLTIANGARKVVQTRTGDTLDATPA